MKKLVSFTHNLLSRQQLIQNRCFHPQNGFIEFEREQIEQSIPARFEAQVRAYPKRIAVKTGDQCLTYEQLNRASNRVAHALLAHRGEREEPVALFLNHGPAMLIAIMGALKAGKIYVALDRSFPQIRTRYILEDTQAGLVVTDTHNLGLAQELTRNKSYLLNLDDIDPAISEENPQPALSPDRIAYILYTSGSTGQPKGVYQNHRNLLHNIMQYTNTLHLCRYDKLTLLYSCSVNGSLRDIFGALLNGASVHPYNVKEEGLTCLGQWLVEEEITFYHSVPTLFRHFMEILTGHETFPDMRLIRFGGERVPSKNVDLYKKYFPDHCIMYTGMGATETSTVRQLFIDKETPIEMSVVPTGFAVAERDVLLLDENDQEVGFNEVGQIAIRSAYLALGYWQKAALTQEKMKPDPTNSAARIYYTGDLGLLLPTGCLIHFGRKDFQVKVRGYRIEVAEIEGAFLAHPDLKEAVVTARKDEFGGQRLVAYFVSREKQPPTVGELKRFLQEKIPDHMIPTVFVALDKLPLTPNGKINRLALPEPDPTRPDLDSKLVPPRNKLEHQLVRIWEELLGVQPIGVTDNFFELGGYSLLAMQLTAKIEAVFGQKVALSTLFQAPTIAQLADILAQEGWSSPFSALVALKTEGTKTPLFCLPGNMGNVFNDLRYITRYLDPDRPLYGFQDTVQNFTKIETVAATYLREIQIIQPHGPYLLCGICWGGPVAFEIAQQLQAQGESVALLALVEPSRPWRAGLWPYLYFAGTAPRRLMQSLWRHSLNTTQLQTVGRSGYIRLKLKVLFNQWATRRYTPKPYHKPLMLIMGQESLKRGHNPRIDWRRWVKREVELYEIPGSHDTITGNNNTPIEEAAMQALTERLESYIRETLTAGKNGTPKSKSIRYLGQKKAPAFPLAELSKRFIKMVKIPLKTLSEKLEYRLQQTQENIGG